MSLDKNHLLCQKKRIIIFIYLCFYIMSTYGILILLSCIVISSYLFEMLAKKTRFPSVLLLIFSGILIKYVTVWLKIEIPYVDMILPVIGSLGLILIVLEGALELKINRNKIKLIRKTFLAAFLILVFTSAGITFLFSYTTNSTFADSFLNAIPYCVISSAIAIPSVLSLSKAKREFIIYEATFSDILGIVIFNFALINQEINYKSFLNLLLDTGAIILVTIIACIVLIFLLRQIKHKIKFFLILSVLILIYAIGNTFHLSSLIVVLVFGILVSNFELIRIPYIQKFLAVDGFKRDIHQLYNLNSETAFLVRTFFFIAFGFTVNIESFNDPLVFIYGAGILAIIYLIRLVYLKWIARTELFPELFIAPRGLISILLFFYIPDFRKISDIDHQSLLFFIILSMSLLMSFGLMFSKRQVEHKKHELETGNNEFESQNN